MLSEKIRNVAKKFHSIFFIYIFVRKDTRIKYWVHKICKNIEYANMCTICKV